MPSLDRRLSSTNPGWPELHEYDQAEHVWDRQKDEPAKAYDAFRMYRDLQPTQRNLAIIAERIYMSERRMRAWANRWDWRGRAEAWDDECHRVEDQERLEAIRQMHNIHRRAARQAIGKALQALQALSPETMTPATIIRLLDLGTRLERSTLIVNVEELQGIEVQETDEEDPWERIARELDPSHE